MNNLGVCDHNGPVSKVPHLKMSTCVNWRAIKQDSPYHEIEGTIHQNNPPISVHYKYGYQGKESDIIPALIMRLLENLAHAVKSNN